jgi:hypothetical protein
MQNFMCRVNKAISILEVFAFLLFKDDGATNATFEREHLAMGAAAAASGSAPVYSEVSN